MGNVLAQPSKLQPELVTELPNVVLKDTLGGGRFLKTLLCVHDQGGLVVVKVYQKRADSPSLESYKQQLATVRVKLQGIYCPHVWPFQAFVDTPSAGYVMRQHLFANLYERLSTRPFLANIEKRWLAFQLLHGVAQCHERGVCHGDIKCENVLLTSWGWLFLADFAVYKPAHIPADNPAEFSFYFDTGGRRSCYIAPERFYPATTESKPVGQLAPEMDIFSLGCVIAELFLDGKAFMDLGQLLGYKRQEFDPSSRLAGLEADVRELVMHMVQLDPADRWPATRYLNEWSPSLFPSYFDSLLHPFFNSLLTSDTDARVEAARSYFPLVKAQITAATLGGAPPPTNSTTTGPFKAQSGLPPNTSADQSVRPPKISTGDQASSSAGPASSQQPPPSGTATPGGSTEPKTASHAGATGTEATPADDASGGFAQDKVAHPRDPVTAASGQLPGGSSTNGTCGESGREESLLDHVGALLAGRSAASTSSTSTHEADDTDHDDDGFLIDDADLHPPSSPESLAPSDGDRGGTGGAKPKAVGVGVEGGGGAETKGGGSDAAAGDLHIAIDELMTEEFFEYQARESMEEDWGEHSKEGDEGAIPSPSNRPLLTFPLAGGAARKEDVALPAEGGWIWADSEWYLDPKAALREEEDGWEYRDVPQVAAPADGSTPSTGRKWTTQSSETALLRRRRWLRRRRRGLVLAPASSATTTTTTTTTTTINSTSGGTPATATTPPPSAPTPTPSTTVEPSQAPPPLLSSTGPTPSPTTTTTTGAATTTTTGATHPTSLSTTTEPLTGSAAAATAATTASPSHQETHLSRPSPSVGGGLGPPSASPFHLTPSNPGVPIPTLTTALTTPLLYRTNNSSIATNMATRAPLAVSATSHAGDGMVLMAVLLCSLLRGSRLQESKRAATAMLAEAAMHCDDEVKLQCVVPYLITLLGDGSASVRTLAIRSLVKVMCAINVIPPGDSKVFQDYLIPSLSLLPNDSEEAVRVEYASGIPHLAASAHAHLLRMQQQSNDTAMAAAEQGTGGVVSQPVRLDTDLTLLRSVVERVVLELVTGVRSSSEIKRALLNHAVPLASFFGRRDLNDRLLPLLITCLNAAEWQLRSAFFEAVSSIGAHTGRESLDVFLLPCLEQALTDSASSVVADAVRCIASVSQHLRKRSLLAAVQKASPLLRHSAPAVRFSVIAFIAASARVLPPADVYTRLVLLLESHLKREPLDMTNELLLAQCLRQPGDSDGEESDDEDEVGMSLERVPPNVGFSPRVWGLPARQGPKHPPSGPSIFRMKGAATGKLPSSSGSVLPTTSRFALAAKEGGHSTGPPPLLLSTASPGNHQGGRVLSPPGGGGEEGGESYSEQMMMHPVAPLHTFDIDMEVEVAAANLPGCPTSIHKKALVSIVSKIERLGRSSAEIAERLTREPASIEAQERMRLERLSATIQRLKQPYGTDVRISSTLDNFRLAQLSSRLSPLPNDLSPSPDLAATSAAAKLSQSLMGGQAGAGGGTASFPPLSPTNQPTSSVSDAVAAAMAMSLPSAMGGKFSGEGHGGVNPGPGGPSAAATHMGAGGAGSSHHQQASLAQTYEGPGGGSGGGLNAWRPRGILVAHMMEHRKGVNQLALARNGSFFVSASNDETLKVWDLGHLERDVSFHSRLTYAAQSGRITSVTAVEEDVSVASASTSGSIHVWRVETTGGGPGTAPDKYSGVLARRHINPSCGSVLQLQQWGPSTLLYTTQKGGIHAWDLRCKGDAWVLPTKGQLGLTEQLVADPQGRQHWVLGATNQGFLSVWDVRFQMCVKSWQHPLRAAIDAMVHACAPSSWLGLPPAAAAPLSSPSPSHATTSSAPLVYIAAGHHEVGLWDVAEHKCLQVVRCFGPAEVEAETKQLQQMGAGAVPTQVPGSLHPVNSTRAHQQPHLLADSLARANMNMVGMASDAPLDHPGGPHLSNSTHTVGALGVDKLMTPQPRAAGVRCLLPLPTGQLLTGSSDRCLRYWDTHRPDNSYLVCGPLWPQDNLAAPSGGLSVPQYRYVYSSCNMEGTVVLEERCSLDSMNNMSEGSLEMRHKMRVHDQVHGDAITHMAVSEASGSRMLLSCSRDGGIKAWR